MATLEYGNHKVDLDAVPDVSKMALMSRGFAHKMGNEVAAAVVARIRNELGGDPSRDAIKTYRETDEGKVKVDAWTGELRDAIVSDIMAGTLGERASGPRKDPVDKKFDQLVLSFIAAQLKPHGLKLPKDDETPIVFKNGATRTRSEMITNVTASQGDKLRVEAERLVKEEQRLADRAARDSAKAETFDPDAAGL